SFDRVVAEMEQTRSQVRRVGINVNAMTKVAHSSGEVPSDLADVRAQLDAVMPRLDGMEGALMNADGDDGWAGSSSGAVGLDAQGGAAQLVRAQDKDGRGRGAHTR